MKNQLEKKNNKSNKNEGITLIALVVTIIVLLILAGISIQMLTGDNGILNRAAEAKENTEQSQLEEQRRLASMEAATNLTETVYNDGEKEIKIPSGFAPTGIEGENTVEDGLVITDSKGNEFVWVEVPKDSNVYKNAGMDVKFTDDNDYLNIAKDLAIYSGSTLSNDPTSLADHLPPADKVGKDYTNEYKDVLKSIYQNGGFWVGRYETGIQGTENATTSARVGTSISTEYPTEGNVAVIKENVQPYTWLRWGQAQTLAQGFLPATNNSNHANLLMGVQWDLVLKFLGKSGDKDSHEWGNYRDSVFNLKPGSHYAKYSSSLSTTWKAYNEDEAGFIEASEKKSLSSGNGVLYTTGANTNQNSKKNICDIAGNVWEWTIERTSYSDYPCSLRGGIYGSTGSSRPASYRSRFDTSSSYDRFGFRVSLY